MSSRAADRTTLLALAGAGAVAGHALGYLASFADPGLRQTVLTESGHGYWGTAVAVAVLAGVVGAVVRFAGHLRRDVADRRFALRLALAQSVLFVAVEALERLVAGTSLSHFFGQHLLTVGILVQILTALVLVGALRVLARATEVILRVLRRPRAARSAPLRLSPPRARPVVAILAATGAPRAPPRL